MCPCFEYQLLNTETYAKSFCSNCLPSVGNWLLNGKLPETITVKPSTSVQVVTATAKNRYLDKVVVLATSTTGS